MVKAVIVGGSIGGLSAAVALRKAGCDVVVIERAAAIIPAGAGLGLDPITCKLMGELGFAEEFNEISRSISCEEYRWVDSSVPLQQRKATSLVVNDKHLHRSLHWSDLHRMLYQALPEGTVHFAHKMVSFEQSETEVTVTAEKPSPAGGSERVKVSGDILVGADGSNSSVRKLLIPDDKRRYSGMIAWRGVVKGDEHPELLQRLMDDFDSLKNGIIFDIADRCMNLIYMLPGNRINWLWYRDAPEPDLIGHSVTCRATAEDIQKLHDAGDATWTPAFAELIRTTAAPFINVIYDKDPVQQWAFGRVVMLGEAAHPTTPHGSRSTNMSLQDSGTLGRCIAATMDNLPRALQEFERLRIPQTSQEVLFSRYVGEVRQGRWFDPISFDWPRQEHATKRLLLNALRSEKDYKTTALKELQRCSAFKQQNGTIRVN